MNALRFLSPMAAHSRRPVTMVLVVLAISACTEPYASNSTVDSSVGSSVNSISRQSSFAHSDEEPEESSVKDSFGSFEKPFSARSYWNIRPVGTRLGSYQIPDSYYYPLIGEGPYSSAAFLAQANDQPMQVFGRDEKTGLWELDGEQFIPSITIPRWPASTVPATGSDGHADIVDTIEGVVHSFLNLKKDSNGRWTASMYAWTRLDGRGWGDPSHYYQGARAAAVPPLAGLIRKHEINDGKPLYEHALAVSLTHNGLSDQIGYIFPATSADTTWKENTGKIPEGALLMLPETFDTTSIQDPALRKVAETLKVYGAYVVDRNGGTPFYIYVENGAQFNLHKPKWNNAVAVQLRRIQNELRQVVGVNHWVDGNGQAFKPAERLNMISMRGPWVKTTGTGTARYDTWSQSLVITGASRRSQFEQQNGRSFNSTSWGKMQAGQRYKLRVRASEGTQFELKVFAQNNNRVLFRSGWMKNHDSMEFIWPADPARTILTVVKSREEADGDKQASIRAFLHPLDTLVTNPLTESKQQSAN